MKRGFSLYLPVKLSNINIASIEQVDFVFKMQKTSRGSVLKESAYKSDGTGDVSLRQGTCIFDIPWSKSETYAVPPNSTVYMDTRIHVADSENNPETPIVSFTMSDTLFEEGEI